MFKVALSRANVALNKH